jgi:hypothetical protein
MEWLALVIWLLVAAIGAPLAITGLFVSPALALQALLGVGGLALCVLYIALGGGSALAWGSAAAAGLGVLAVLAGTAALVSDSRHGRGAGQTAEEVAASLAGVQLGLFGVAGAIVAMAALGLNTV